MNNMGLKRELSNPLTEEEANSLTEDEKVWLRNWNRESEIPGEGSDADAVSDSLYPNGAPEATGGDSSEYDDLSVDELKDELRDRELPVSGNKQELIDRLVADDESSDDEDDDDDE